MKMLILRGVAGHYDGRDWPKGALYEEPALKYAQYYGFEGQVLDVAGATIPDGPQIRLALQAYRSDQTVQGLYGFSGGGYNLLPIIRALTKIERQRLQRVVVLGAPNYNEDWYKGSWTLVYRKDPPGGHMAGPQALLDSLPSP